jgi:hypothetical protein
LGTAAHADTAVIGMGGFLCGQFIATIGKLPPGRMNKMQTHDGDLVTENTGYVEWLAGFVSGFNFAQGGAQEMQVIRIDLAGMDLWMRNWCNKHPTQTVFEGGAAFIHEMRNNAAAPANDK